MHSTGSGAQPVDRFVVRYSGRHPGFYLARTLPLSLLFGVLVVLYLEDDYRSLIFSRFTSRPKPFSWLEFGFLQALVLAPLIDLILTLLRVRNGAIALSVSPEGITGPVFHFTRFVPWSEIEDVAVDGKFLVIRRQQRSLFRPIFAGRGIFDISLATHHLDRSAAEVLTAVRRATPASQGTASYRVAEATMD